MHCDERLSARPKRQNIRARANGFHIAALPACEAKLGRNTPRDRGVTPVFKKHAILVEFDQDRKCATATKRHRHVRSCARLYWRNNAALRCGQESTRSCFLEGDGVFARDTALAIAIATLAAIDGTAAQTANQPPDTLAAWVEACTRCHGNKGEGTR
jgi:cytochrome c553